MPNDHVEQEAYALFLQACVPGDVRGPLVLIHDNGRMHHGPAVEALRHGHPRLTLERLPAYTPELNPVEGLWNHAKDKELANFVAPEVPTLLDAACDCLTAVRRDRDRLRSFFLATPLSWHGTTLSI